MPQSAAAKRPVEEGGFGWAVTAGSFLMNAVEDGITFSYGILAVALIDYFDASRQQVGWVGSIMIGVTYLASEYCLIVLYLHSIAKCGHYTKRFNLKNCKENHHICK